MITFNQSTFEELVNKKKKDLIDDAQGLKLSITRKTVSELIIDILSKTQTGKDTRKLSIDRFRVILKSRKPALISISSKLSLKLGKRPTVKKLKIAIVNEESEEIKRIIEYKDLIDKYFKKDDDSGLFLYTDPHKINSSPLSPIDTPESDIPFMNVSEKKQYVRRIVKAEDELIEKYTGKDINFYKDVNTFQPSYTLSTWNDPDGIEVWHHSKMWPFLGEPSWKNAYNDTDENKVHFDLVPGWYSQVESVESGNSLKSSLFRMREMILEKYNFIINPEQYPAYKQQSVVKQFIDFGAIKNEKLFTKLVNDLDPHDIESLHYFKYLLSTDYVFFIDTTGRIIYDNYAERIDPTMMTSYYVALFLIDTNDDGTGRIRPINFGVLENNKIPNAWKNDDYHITNLNTIM